MKDWHQRRAQDFVSSTLGDFYAQSNQLVTELIDVPLQEFGYVVSTAAGNTDTRAAERGGPVAPSSKVPYPDAA